MNNEGFNVSRNRAEADVVFTVDFNFYMMENRAGENVSYSFSPSVQATLNGRSGIIISYHSPPLSRTVTLTQEAGRRRSFTALIAAWKIPSPLSLEIAWQVLMKANNTFV